MRLKDNKRHIIDNKVFYSVRQEINITKSTWDRFRKQGIWINGLIGSEYLLRNIYDDIRREQKRHNK